MAPYGLGPRNQAPRDLITKISECANKHRIMSQIFRRFCLSPTRHALDSVHRRNLRVRAEHHWH